MWAHTEARPVFDDVISDLRAEAANREQESLAGKLLQRQFAAFGERVCATDRGHHPILPERLKFAARMWFRAGNERDVETASEDRRYVLLRCGLANVERNTRVLSKPSSQETARKACGDGSDNADAQPALDRLAGSADSDNCAVQAAEEPARLLQKLLTSEGESHALAVAFEQ